MAKDYAVWFYNSTAWRLLADWFRKDKGYVCNRCGDYGNEVHHIEEITPDNIHDVSITLNQDNLELLCHKCHTQETLRKHKNTSQDLIFDEDGYVVKPPHID